MVEKYDDESNKCYIKLTDFGFAAEADQTEGVGSRLYMAPEILNGKSYNEKVDIWAAGVIAVFLFSGGKDPFGFNQEE